MVVCLESEHARLLSFLSLRLSILEKILRSLLGHKIFQDRFSGHIKASATVTFPLELERAIGNNVTLSTLPDLRARPSV